MVEHCTLQIVMLWNRRKSVASAQCLWMTLRCTLRSALWGFPTFDVISFHRIFLVYGLHYGRFRQTIWQKAMQMETSSAQQRITSQDTHLSTQTTQATSIPSKDTCSLYRMWRTEPDSESCESDYRWDVPNHSIKNEFHVTRCEAQSLDHIFKRITH